MNRLRQFPTIAGTLADGPPFGVTPGQPSEGSRLCRVQDPSFWRTERDTHPLAAVPLHRQPEIACQGFRVDVNDPRFRVDVNDPRPSRLAHGRGPLAQSNRTPGQTARYCGASIPDAVGDDGLQAVAEQAAAQRIREGSRATRRRS